MDNQHDLHRILPAALVALSACNLLGTTDWCDPTSRLYPHLSPAELAECEQSETGGEDGPYQAWCFLEFDDEPNREWCYPAEHGKPGREKGDYALIDCAAVFDFDSWNYDGTCDNEHCEPVPTVSRLCFDDDHAEQVSGKVPGDVSVRTCWKDPYFDVDASIYVSYEHLDDEMHEPLCAEQEIVSEIGPLCVYDQGVVCQIHNMFCACKCSSDADCEAPSVCEGYYPGQQTPSFCVYSDT